MSTADDHAGYDGRPMRSCVYGLAVGDALGVPYEFRARGTFECTGMAGGGRRIGPHGGHVPDGRVPVCGKGGPPMREIECRRGNRGSAAIFPERCEPEGVGDDR